MTDALRRGEAVATDLTNQWIRKWGHDVPEVSPEDSGRVLARLAKDNDFTAFEFMLTDKAGHGRKGMDPVKIVERLDRAFAATIDASDQSTLIVLTSDHGNIEESTSRHTRNAVPLIAVGPGHEQFAARVRAITDVAPTILELLGVRSQHDQKVVADDC